MPPTAPTSIDDLTDLSETGAVLERLLKNWVVDLGDLYGGPDIVTMGEAIGFLARLTAIRKSLIKLAHFPSTGLASAFSPLVVPPPTDVIPQPNAQPSTQPDRSNDPSSLASLASLPSLESCSSREIQEIPSLRDLPLDRIESELSRISEDLHETISDSRHTQPAGGPPPPAPSASGVAPDPSDPSDQSDPSDSSLSSLPQAVPALPDRRAVLLNIHPIRDTSLFPDNHPIFDRDQYGATKRYDEFLKRKRNRSG